MHCCVYIFFSAKFVERYDTADNQWVHFCKVPAPRNHHAVVTIGQSLYLIGMNLFRVWIIFSEENCVELFKQFLYTKTADRL